MRAWRVPGEKFVFTSYFSFFAFSFSSSSSFFSYSGLFLCSHKRFWCVFMFDCLRERGEDDEEKEKEERQVFLFSLSRSLRFIQFFLHSSLHNAHLSLCHSKLLERRVRDGDGDKDEGKGKEKSKTVYRQFSGDSAFLI